MSQEFSIELSGDMLEAIPRIKDQAGYARAMAREMDYQNRLTVSQIQRGHMSGPTTDSSLSVRTNRLRNSVNASKAIILGTGVASTIGSNVVYARRHEFGFDGDEDVRPFMRKNTRVQSFKFGGKTVRKRIRGADIYVRGFKRHVHTPARAPFGHGIADRLPDYTEGFDRVTTKYLKGEEQ